MGAPSRLVRVALADDNVDLTDALERLLRLEPDMECVGCVTDAGRIVAEVARTEPDVLVMDLSMPGGDTATIIGELRIAAPTVRTIVFSGYSDDERIERSLAAGASQFVGKHEDVHRLVHAIRSVAADANHSAGSPRRA